MYEWRRHCVDSQALLYRKNDMWCCPTWELDYIMHGGASLNRRYNLVWIEPISLCRPRHKFKQLYSMQINSLSVGLLMHLLACSMRKIGWNLVSLRRVHNFYARKGNAIFFCIYSFPCAHLRSIDPQLVPIPKEPYHRYSGKFGRGN